MKGKKFYIALIGLFVIGVGSFFIYRQQKEARALEFEGYEIATIEDRVNGLYNDEKTDIKEDIESELLNLDQIFVELNEKDLSNRSEKQISEMEEEFLTAKSMYELEESILNLFNDDIIRRNTSLKKVVELEDSLIAFEDKKVYYKWNKTYTAEARLQVETIEEVTDLVENLISDDGLNEEVDEEDINELEVLIKEIKDETVQEKMLAKIETARLALEQRKSEAVVLDETEVKKLTRLILKKL